MQWIFLSVLLKRIKAIRFFMKDKEVPKRKKLIIILGILFLISPINLITIPVFGLGLVDDIILWSFIIYYLRDELDKYWVGEGEGQSLKDNELKGKDIIEDVDFEVEVDDANSDKDIPKNNDEPKPEEKDKEKNDKVEGDS
ncbi:MAG: hypothetical protein WCF96_06305 [Eubacteriales bacterium]